MENVLDQSEENILKCKPNNQQLANRRKSHKLAKDVPTNEQSLEYIIEGRDRGETMFDHHISPKSTK